MYRSRAFAMTGQVEIVRLLLEVHKADINKTDSEGDNALHACCRTAKSDGVEQCADGKGG